MENTNTNYDDQIEYFIELLSKEIQIYTELSSIVLKKQKSIIAGNLEMLQDTIGREHKLVQRAQASADMLGIQIDVIKKTFNVPSDKKQIIDIIPLLPQQFADKLTSLRNQLKTNIQQTSKINKENNYLLKSSISFVKNMVNVFLRAGTRPQNMYNVTGIIAAQPEANKLLDCQI